MNKVMVPVTLPNYKVISEDEKALILQEEINRNGQIYYKFYTVARDKLVAKEICKHLDTEDLKLLRDGINYELRKRRRK